MGTLNTTVLITMFALCLGCTGCGNKKTDNYGPLVIQGSDFHVTEAPLFTKAVESSIVTYNNSIVYMIDHGMNGDLSINTNSIGSGYRFSYVMQHDGVYYNFYQFDGAIHVTQSTDLVNWTHDQAALNFSPDNFSSVYNPSVTVDDHNVWHILVECDNSNDSSKTGLCYSTTEMHDGVLNFDLNKQAIKSIDLAGNPWIQFVSGKGIIAVYGRQINGLWDVRAGILENGMIKESSTFNIGAPGIHVCDPHLMETADGVTMTVSYNQRAIYELKTTKTLSELFDIVSQ